MAPQGKLKKGKAATGPTPAEKKKFEMEKKNIPDDSVVVCTLTGHGLKDPDIAIKQSPEPITIPKGGDGLRDLILSSID